MSTIEIYERVWREYKKELNAYRKSAERSADERGLEGYAKIQYVSMAVWSYQEGIALVLSKETAK